MQLKTSELSIIELFKNLLNELKGFKYQITVAVLLSKVSQSLNISSYLPFNGSTYIKLSNELKHPMKGLINIQNNDNKCFMWFHVRHLNLVGNKMERIRKEDREIKKKT